MLEKFHHVIPADKIDGADKDYDLVLPRFKNLPFGVMRKIRKVEPAEQIFEIFEQLLERDTITEDDLNVLDAMTIEDIGSVMEAWQKDAEVDLPES